MIADVNCRSCGMLNLVPLGDMQDVTRPDVDGFKCWNCKKISPLDDDKTYREVHCLGADESVQEHLETEGFIEDGEKR